MRRWGSFVSALEVIPTTARCTLRRSSVGSVQLTLLLVRHCTGYGLPEGEKSMEQLILPLFRPESGSDSWKVCSPDLQPTCVTCYLVHVIPTRGNTRRPEPGVCGCGRLSAESQAPLFGLHYRSAQAAAEQLRSLPKGFRLIRQPLRG